VGEEKTVPQNRNILKDQIITFNSYLSKKKYPYPLRRIEVWDEEKKETITLLTNHLTFGSTTIAAIYKDRWQIGASSQGHITQSVQVRPGPTRLKAL